MKKYRGKYIPFVVKKDSGSFLCLFQKILKSIAENKKKDLSLKYILIMYGQIIYVSLKLVIIISKSFLLKSRKCFRVIYSLKLVSAIFYQIFVSHQMIALQKLWKMFFISSKKLFSFSKYSNFCISVFPSFSPC